MITVSELIAKLSMYASQSPENGNAEIMMQYDHDVCFEFDRADDTRGMVPGEHFLIFVPNVLGKRIKVREIIRQ